MTALHEREVERLLKDITVKLNAILFVVSVMLSVVFVVGLKVT